MTNEATLTHAKLGRWTPTRCGLFEVFLVKKTRHGVLFHTRKIDKGGGNPIESKATKPI